MGILLRQLWIRATSHAMRIHGPTFSTLAQVRTRFNTRHMSKNPEFNNLFKYPFKVLATYDVIMFCVYIEMRTLNWLVDSQFSTTK